MPPPPPEFFFCKIDALKLILTQLHLATEFNDTIASCHGIYTIIIRNANHRIIAHGRNILDYDIIASCHRIYTIIIRKANHRIIAHGQNIPD